MSDLREKYDRAWRELESLCLGKRWRMTVPVDLEDDSDIVISEALAAASEIEAENRVLRARLAAVEALAGEWDAEADQLNRSRHMITELRAALASVPAVDAGDREPASEAVRAAEHLRRCSEIWDGGTVGRFPILRHRWRDALRNGVAFAAMELDRMAREEDQ